MNGARSRVIAVGSVVLAAGLMAAAAETPLRLTGGYLVYSFDSGLVYGEKTTFRLGDVEISSRYLKIDTVARVYAAVGDVVVRKAEDRREADELLFNPVTRDGILVRFRDRITVEPFDSSHPPAEGAQRNFLAQDRILERVTPAELRASLVYAEAGALEIDPNGDVMGFDVMIYIEGLESVGFAKLKLSSGEKPGGGLSLDKIWFTKTQGLFGKASLSTRPEAKIKSSTQIDYEEHSVLKDYAGLPRQLDVQTSTSWSPGEKTNLGIGGNYNSSSLWNARVWFDGAWHQGRNGFTLDLAYDKPLARQGETWLGLKSSLDFGSWGRLGAQGRYEVHGQVLADLSYEATLAENVQLRIVSNYARVRPTGSGSPSEIFNGNVALAYNARLFNLATDYDLHYDLFGNQRLMRPQLRLAFRPVIFYSGLLTLTAQNIFVLNAVKREELASQSFSNNTALALAAAPMTVLPGTTVQASLAVEQFLEKEGRNFTSGGLIVRAEQRVSPAVSFEEFYSVQSRRRSRGWLVEGTTSQDLSAVLRVNPSLRINGWVSFSFDPKTGGWKQSFADLTIGLIRNWRFQSQANYDFGRRRIDNVDLSLIRAAGRSDLRFIWRSISKQFLVEFVPTL